LLKGINIIGKSLISNSALSLNDVLLAERTLFGSLQPAFKAFLVVYMHAPQLIKLLSLLVVVKAYAASIVHPTGWGFKSLRCILRAVLENLQSADLVSGEPRYGCWDMGNEDPLVKEAPGVVVEEHATDLILFVPLSHTEHDLVQSLSPKVGIIGDPQFTQATSLIL
jgi:hypothetical protein